MSNFREVIGLKEYRKYFVASLLASIGNGMFFVAVAWFVFNESDSAMAIGWLLIATTLPGLLLSPVIGVFVDKSNSKHVCSIADMLRGIIMMALALGIGTETVSLLHIFISTFFIALCDNFFQPAIGALIRDIVTKDNLLPANIVGSMAVQIGTLIGASLGGIAISIVGTESVVWINAGTFILSAILIIWIKHHRAEAVIKDQKVNLGVIAQFKLAIEVLPDKIYVLRIVIQQILAYLTLFMCNTLLPGFVVRDLNAGAESFGLIDAGWGVGAIIGGLLLSPISKRAGVGKLGSICLIAFGISLVALLTAQVVLHAVLAYLALGCLAVMIRINGDTEILRIVDPSHYAKIKSGIIMMISWSSLIVYGSIGYIGDAISARYIFAVAACIVFCTGVVMLLNSRESSMQPANP